MIKNKVILENFYNEYIRHRHYSYARRFEIYEGLLKEARQWKRVPSKNFLEGIESCLRISAILNSFK